MEEGRTRETEKEELEKRKDSLRKKIYNSGGIFEVVEKEKNVFI